MAIDAVLRAEGRRAVEGGRIQRVREAARLSQTELGMALGVTQTAVALWEKGKRVPRGATAERLARLLNDLEAGA
jgi:transcriptional regulator with XRE-family HTH domain